jgi:hypothetical protein
MSSEWHELRLIKPDRGGGDVFFHVSELPEGQQVSDNLVPANVPEYFAVTPGQVFSFISTSTSSGYVSLTESQREG